MSRRRRLLGRAVVKILVSIAATISCGAYAASPALLLRIDPSELTLAHGQALLFVGVQVEGDEPASGTLVRNDGGGAATTYTADANGFISVDEYITGPAEFAFVGAGCACDRRLGNIALDLVRPTRVSDTYSEWIARYPAVGALTNYTDNPDGDPGNNLFEYALGGNPTNAEVTGFLTECVLVEQDGTQFVDFIYYKRRESWLLGLTYTLETTDDLMGPAWSNVGYQVLGAAPYDAVFDAVSNRVNTTDAQKFMRLGIQID